MKLDLSEDIVLRNHVAALRALPGLEADGVGTTFDDHGTGFASLSLSKTYPVTELKAHRSLVRRTSESTQDVAIERDLLVAGGCEEIQGYLHGRPMNASSFAETFGLGEGERTRTA